MKNSVLMMSLTGVILAGLATQSIAAGDHDRHHRGEHPSFEELDVNGDGQVTRDELESHKIARFSEADANGDGQLTRDEMRARVQAKVSARLDRRLDRIFEDRDANSDGTLSLEEMGGGRMERMFAKVDTNEDGVVSQAEFDEMSERHRSRHSGASE